MINLDDLKRVLDALEGVRNNYKTRYHISSSQWEYEIKPAIDTIKKLIAEQNNKAIPEGYALVPIDSVKPWMLQQYLDFHQRGEIMRHNEEGMQELATILAEAMIAAAQKGKRMSDKKHTEINTLITPKNTLGRPWLYSVPLEFLTVKDDGESLMSEPPIPLAAFIIMQSWTEIIEKNIGGKSKNTGFYIRSQPMHGFGDRPAIICKDKQSANRMMKFLTKLFCYNEPELLK